MFGMACPFKVCPRWGCVCAQQTRLIMQSMKTSAPAWLVEPTAEQCLPASFVDFDGLATIEVHEVPDERAE